MQIEYKILWLDDQIESFIDDEYVDEIKEFLEKEGFEASIDTVDNASDFFQKLNDTYDLILTDYHMSEKNGDEVVRETRNRCKILSEILFYTARADLKDIIKLDRISFLQTNSSGATHQRTVIQKVKYLISLTIQKFHDIVVMRGMIMNETSVLDNQKIQLLNNFIILDKYSDKIPQLRDRLFREISCFLKEKTIKIEKCIKKDDLDKLIKDNVLFSADKKISAMSEILQILGEADFSSEYKEEIIKVRNNFAHAVLEEEKDEKGKIIRKYFKDKKDGITYDKNYCKTIRLNITKHRKNLKILEERLNE